MSDQPSIDVVALQLWAGSWQDWTGSVASISIQRGGGITVDVGLMTVVLIRDDDPLAEDDILPSQPIRVVRKGTSQTIFTGIIENAAVGIVRDGGGGVRNGITITAVDAVASHTKNTRYGAVTPGGVGHETWAARIARVALSSETTVSLPSEPDTPYPWECQDVAYVSSLASHFDLACQTVGANWYVGSDNVTRFRAPDDDTGSVATFSDQLEDAHQYLDIVVDSGSKQVVNVLKITNHGRGNDGNTFDVAQTFEDAGSVLAWGARAASSDMCVWDADTMLSGRAEVLFDAYADPVREVREIAWDGQQDPALAAALDIQSPITVLLGAEEFETRIVAMSHEIGPSSWSITMQTSTRGVGEAQAVNDAYASTSATGATPVDRDARAPQAPTGLTVDPFAAWQGGEIVLAISAEWDAVTVGDNGAPIEISLYEVWGRPGDGSTPAKQIGRTAGLEVAATDPAFVIGDEWLVKVRAASSTNVWSPFSAEEAVTLTQPAEDLSAPTAPIISTAPGLGVVKWDGYLAGDPLTSAPAFLRDVLVQTAATDDAPDEDWIAQRYLFGAGDVALIAAPVGASMFVRFVPFDRLGRAGDPSEVAAMTIIAAPASFLDIAALKVSLIEAGLGGDLDISVNGAFEVLAGQIAETRSVFRVTPSGAEVRQEGIAGYLRLLAEAVQLIGPAGTVGAELTASGLEAPVVITKQLQHDHFIWAESADGDHLTLRSI